MSWLLFRHKMIPFLPSMAITNVFFTLEYFSLNEQKRFYLVTAH